MEENIEIAEATRKFENRVYQRTSEGLEKLIAEKYDSLEVLIDNKITQRFNFFITALAIAIPILIGLVITIFFYLQGQIYTTNIELAQLNTNFNYFVNPPIANIQSQQIAEIPSLAVNTTGIP